MNDSVGVLSTLVLGVLAAWAVAGWVRSQTNKGRTKLEAENAELKERNTTLAGQVRYLGRQNANLRNEKYALQRRLAERRFDRYPRGGTGPLPSIWADGKPTHTGKDAGEETKKTTLIFPSQL